MTGFCVALVAGCGAIQSRFTDTETITDSGWGAPPPVAVPEAGDAALDAADAETLVNQYAQGALAAGNGARNPLYEPTPTGTREAGRDASKNGDGRGVIWDEPDSAARSGYRAPSDATSRAFGTSRKAGATPQPAAKDANRLPVDGGVSVQDQAGPAYIYTASGGGGADRPDEMKTSGGRVAPHKSVAELFQALAALIEESNDDDLVKAVRLDALALVDPAAGEALRLRSDPSASLDSEQKKIAELYRDVIALIGEELTGNKTDTRPGTLAELKARFDALDGANPLTVKRAELCRSVRGFGVYDPFESNTFVAGRTQPMIIYLELDNFASKAVGGSDQEVKLTQEVEIYNKADGLLVWKKKPDQIVDRSRNRRRDFFTVQMIEVPARLTVGEFTIKVRVTDHHGNALDETNIPLNMVADRSLTLTKP